MTSIFKAFLEPDVDRPAFIAAFLRAREVPVTEVTLSGKRHVIVRFRPEAYDPRFRMKTFVAHHDRVPGSPGANDNSAACFQLMIFASRLAASAARHNVRIIFTDGEEAGGVTGIAGQGSFALGNALNARGEDLGDVYVFDCTGRGDTLVLSQSGLSGIAHRALSERMASLHERARQSARAYAQGDWICLPTPYSDNAGFLASGIPAQVVTVLPAEEATRLLASQSPLARSGAPATERARSLKDAIARNKAPSSQDHGADDYPDTWKLMHTAADSSLTLTASAFTLMRDFLDGLARSLEP